MCTTSHEHIWIYSLENQLQLLLLCFLSRAQEIVTGKTGNHPLTRMQRGFSHKINFNFHIFIRPIQAVLRWPRRGEREVEREFDRWCWSNSKRCFTEESELNINDVSHWAVYITTCIYCVWILTVCVHVCIVAVHPCESAHTIFRLWTALQRCCVSKRRYVAEVSALIGCKDDEVTVLINGEVRVKVEHKHSASARCAFARRCRGETNAEFSEQLIMFNIWSSHSLLINWPIYP